MQRLFIVLWTAVVIVVIGLMVLLYVSLIPHFGEIGDAMIWVIRIGLACGVILMLVGTWSLIGSLLAKRARDRHSQRVIAVGDVVAYLAPDGTFVHLSAQHEAAKIPMHTTVAAEPMTSDETIIELFEGGMSRRAIAKQLDIPYNRVQKLLEGK